jgi:DNA polymerase V
MQETPQPKKNVCCSRSFGHPVRKLEDLEEAVANYAVKATYRIRREGSLARGLQVFVMTNRFRKDLPQYFNTRTMIFGEPTDDPILILSNAKTLLRDIYRKGYAYKKAGVLLLDLDSGNQRQTHLFKEHGSEKRRRLVQAMEEVTAAYGPNAAFLAAQGINRSWSMKRGRRTPRYTTNWQELPVVALS